MSPEEEEWFRQFPFAVAKDYNTLAMRIPPRIRATLEACLAMDTIARQLDEQAANINRRVP